MVLEVIMIPKFTKESINFIFNKLASLFNLFFPGVVILELFLKKDIFQSRLKIFFHIVCI